MGEHPDRAGTELADVVATSQAVAATPSRLAKTSAVATLLARAPATDLPVIVAWLSGELPQRQIGVGWAALRTLPVPADEPSLTVATTDAALTRIGHTIGVGSQAQRSALLADLFAAATDAEQHFLRRLLGGELRQGAQRGVMLDAVAQASNVPAAAVRRAAMLNGDLPSVAVAARAGGTDALLAFRLEVGRPVSPMLAQTASSVTDALAKLGGRALLEAKLDGARVQVHRRGMQVSIYTRTLDEVTARLPELVDAVLALAVDNLVADGEAIALRPDARPERFQVTAGRFGRAKGEDADPVRLTLFLFDVLHLDGVDLLDEPAEVRLAALDRIVPASARVPRLITDDPVAAQGFLDDVLARGHEGVMVKSLSAPYEAGRRGDGWLKVKPVHTLDLVVLAVEWGSGRRRGKLSNIHLGARDPETGGFVMLGKTFKGMTDQMLAWQTERFLDLAQDRTDQYVVELRPEQVVEIAFDGVQTSSRYPGGMALRFARVIRYRDDKRPEEADTIDTVRALHAR